MEVFAGNGATIRTPVTDANGDAVPGASITAAQYSVATPLGLVTVVTKALGAGIEKDGDELVITLDPADTSGRSGDYIHQLNVVVAGAISTVWQESLTVVPAVPGPA